MSIALAEPVILLDTETRPEPVGVTEPVVVTPHEEPAHYKAAWLANWDHVFASVMVRFDVSTRQGQQWFNRFNKAAALVRAEMWRDVEQGLVLAEAVLLQAAGGMDIEAAVQSAWLDLNRQADRLVIVDNRLSAEERAGLTAGEQAEMMEIRRMATHSAEMDEAQRLGTRVLDARIYQMRLALGVRYY